MQVERIRKVRKLRPDAVMRRAREARDLALTRQALLAARLRLRTLPALRRHAGVDPLPLLQ
jgi:hypothetical protein